MKCVTQTRACRLGPAAERRARLQSPAVLIVWMPQPDPLRTRLTKTRTRRKKKSQARLPPKTRKRKRRNLALLHQRQSTLPGARREDARARCRARVRTVLSWSRGTARAANLPHRPLHLERLSFSLHIGATMSTPARRRLMRDFKRMQTDPPEGVNGAPCDNDIMKWHAVIFGCAAPRRPALARPPELRYPPAAPGQTTLLGRTGPSS